MQQVTPTKPDQIAKVYMPNIQEKAYYDSILDDNPLFFVDTKSLTDYSVSDILRSQYENYKFVCNYIAKGKLTVMAY